MFLTVVVGHFGLHIAIYNRVNSFGLSRKRVKQIVKCFLVTTIAIPVATVVIWHDLLLQLFESAAMPPFPMAVTVYSAVCIASVFFFGIPWLYWRPVFRVEWVRAPRDIQTVHVAKVLGRSLALTPHCQRMAGLPLNQIFELAIEKIELPVRGLPEKLDGYRIAHLTDIHLTGEFKPDYMKYVVGQANQWCPEMMVLTGDIIDKQPCVSWLGDMFSAADAVDGCYFILGNHDTRVVDSTMTRLAMNQAGWNDVGGLAARCQLRGVTTEIVGSESPWFDSPQIDLVTDSQFRMLLSHSPDEYNWARRHGFQLMLAGHTHGGQGRLPLAGPILSPSWHGSRWASGDFYRTPTTLHVSRGLGGVHLMRINCRPELSLITLRSV